MSLTYEGDAELPLKRDSVNLRNHGGGAAAELTVVAYSPGPRTVAEHALWRPSTAWSSYRRINLRSLAAWPKPALPSAGGRATRQVQPHSTHGGLPPRPRSCGPRRSPADTRPVPPVRPLPPGYHRAGTEGTIGNPGLSLSMRDRWGAGHSSTQCIGKRSHSHSWKAFSSRPRTSFAARWMRPNSRNLSSACSF